MKHGLPTLEKILDQELLMYTKHTMELKGIL